MTALIKECRGLAACVRELHRTRHKLMQAMRGEEIRAITKLSPHRRPKKGRRKETVHANIRQYTFSQDSQQLHRARHSVWMDNHVITSAPSTQQTEPSHPEHRSAVDSHTRTHKAPVTRKRGRGRARPQTISQSTGSSAHPFMHNEDIAVGTLSPPAGGSSISPPEPRRLKTTKRRSERPETLSQSTGSTAHPYRHNEDMGIGGDTPLLYNVNTIVNTNVYSAADDNMNTDDATIDILADDDDNTIVDDMDTDIIVDAVHVYIHGRGPKGRGKPSSTREPDGIG